MILELLVSLKILKIFEILKIYAILGTPWNLRKHLHNQIKHLLVPRTSLIFLGFRVGFTLDQNFSKTTRLVFKKIELVLTIFIKLVK